MQGIGTVALGEAALEPKRTGEIGDRLGGHLLLPVGNAAIEERLGHDGRRQIAAGEHGAQHMRGLGGLAGLQQLDRGFDGLLCLRRILSCFLLGLCGRGVLAFLFLGGFGLGFGLRAGLGRCLRLHGNRAAHPQGRRDGCR